MINTRKTEIMKIRCIADNRRVKIVGNDLKKVEKLTYLTCDINKDRNVWNKVGIMIGKTGVAFRMLHKVWDAHSITMLKLFNSIVIWILTYGCESWKGLKKKMKTNEKI